MFDKDTIKELSKAEALSVANVESAAAVGTAVLPNDFTLYDLEKFMPLRRRLRGAMTTSVIEHFATYTKDNAESGARVFIDPATLQATAVLNIGTTDKPGHGDNTATLKLRQTAAYSALLAVATLYMGLYPKPFTDVMDASVANLLQHVAQSKLR